MNTSTQTAVQIKRLRFALMTLLSAATLLTGCADTPYADAAYGAAFRQTVQAQTLDMAVAINPAAEAPSSSDAARLQNALTAYRSDVAKGTAEVKQQVVFEVGN